MYRAQVSFSIHQTSLCGLRSTSRMPSSPATARPGNWCPHSEAGFSTTATSLSQRVSSSSTPRTSASVRAPERRRALRMPRRERPNCPALLALASGAGATLSGSGALRGRYGGSGIGKVVWRTGKAGSRSRLDGVAMCGLSVKRAVRVRGRRRAVKEETLKRRLLYETYRSLAFVPNASPRCHSDARLSSPELELAPAVRLNR